MSEGSPAPAGGAAAGTTDTPEVPAMPEIREVTAALPATTALGALARHLTESDAKHFQPANINYGLFPELPERPRHGDRRAAFAARAQADLAAWAAHHGIPMRPVAPAPTLDASEPAETAVVDAAHVPGEAGGGS